MANKVMVYAEDMTDDMMNKAIEVGKQAFVKAVIDKPTDQVYPAIAKFIRSRFDKEEGKNWNCIVGRQFGAFVTHEIKTYIYYSVLPGVSILLWKT